MDCIVQQHLEGIQVYLAINSTVSQVNVYNARRDIEPELCVSAKFHVTEHYLSISKGASDLFTSLYELVSGHRIIP